MGRTCMNTIGRETVLICVNSADRFCETAGCLKAQQSLLQGEGAVYSFVHNSYVLPLGFGPVSPPVQQPSTWSLRSRHLLGLRFLICLVASRWHYNQICLCIKMFSCRWEEIPCDVPDPLSLCLQEPSVCDKEALPASESSFRLLGSSDDLSSDSESHPAEEPAPLSPRQSFRRRANTLSHFPVECQEPPEPAQGSPGVSQRKLMRYHSVSTETPHDRK